ncbi:zinc finger matrin-type protein 2 [Frankliniella occidentalis]|uniref:Zinc finger matrin-type protein 2 n=1 Tax=Frankliniella occidentalis TaxID=133901 RepID=A0A6J1SDF4_FRAOC|nr:zinc finger matrin-type protein 2 [Frankliniella occidentalis]
MASGSASGSGGASDAGIEDHRRKWDKEEYEKLAEERLLEELEALEQSKQKPAPVTRELLRQRDYRVDLEGKLGKSVVITKNTPSSQTGGYYCNVCDCVVKDSINFLDHINGKKHQRNLGMSMRIERSSLDQVKKRFELNKRKLEERKKDYDLEQRMKEMREEEDKLKEYRKERKKEKKRKVDDDIDQDQSEGQSELAAIMGFSGFGGSKK